jgi:glutathione S-transferase
VTMALRLYDYAPSANCLKVRLLLARLGHQYERVPVDIFAGETLTDEFARINPARTTPVLELESGEHLQESNAILVYLAEGTPFLPDERVARAHVLRWLFYEQADVVPAIGALRFRLITGRLVPDSRTAAWLHARGHHALQLLDGHLQNRSFLAGDHCTVADLSVFAYTHVAPEAGLELDAYAAVRRWLDRVAAEPGHANDLEPYPPNAQAGVSRSIYD